MEVIEKQGSESMNRLGAKAGSVSDGQIAPLGRCCCKNGVDSQKPPMIDVMRRLPRARSRQGTALRQAFRFIDLFAGIGGLRRGFDAIGGKCVFTSEWNMHARQTYQANYDDGDDHIMAGDIRAVDLKDIPKHDILLAGFPCQPFSIAGLKLGFACKTQGTLFFDIARIIAHHRPRAFLLENVKNLANHDKGNTFRIIRETLKNELGYHIHCKIINAKSFVPQKRERIFIAGFRDDNGFTFDGLALPDPSAEPRLGSILHSEDGSEIPEPNFTTGRKAYVANHYTLTDGLWRCLQRHAEKHRAAGNGFGFGLCGPGDVARTLTARYCNDGAEILIRQNDKNPRRLTPRECARLMGFDKPGESTFKIPVSDTQAYKQFGNAVVVPVVELIARHMAPYLLQRKTATPYIQKEVRVFNVVSSRTDRPRINFNNEVEVAQSFQNEVKGKAFHTILADPPWRYSNRTGKFSPENKKNYHYPTLSLEEIMKIPVQSCLLESAHLYLWVPNALISEGLTVMKAWGFTYKTNLVWHKIRRDGGSDGRGVGFYFRNVTELVLFGVKGRSAQTLDSGRTQVNLIPSQKREHSRKPDELYDLIEKCSKGAYLELFARRRREGWKQWGNQMEDDWR
jgi:DNA (cytosine-5)-methyltransferase 1